ncbi:MAC/Perforin domain-containing protein [Theileria equi strain WA]|uniref:MAC/Perforin domain-containing protein n=1 Tax=Theileria equi strain WA TaxID=1537102 RepID=L0B051_THEEQ|nr:MAC/Perforin domain-containing protein [Theileria equi strain WA]AFZ81232.1 MAC/Perforin domain-containing protein [Theileria equi strain WA]|eukprot:XP_004830898.1 MAC/Perforin domain-containing protein [Theileria equi strain WA]
MLNFYIYSVYLQCFFYIIFENQNFVKTEDVQNLSSEDSVVFTTDKIVTGMGIWFLVLYAILPEYLGSGYDIVKANTLGDSDQGEDLGYRAPVVEFSWAQTDVGVTNSLDWLQPIGGWVRPKVACGESENISEVHSSKDLKNIVEADVSVKVKVPNIGSAAITTNYNDIIKESENVKNKVYTSTYYCFTYAAGMPPSLDWISTEEFQTAVKELPNEFKDFEGCTTDMYEKKSKMCKDQEKWLDFFNEFGTHVVTEVHLGGKLTRFLTVPSSSVESFKNKGYNVNVAIGAALSGIDGTIAAGVSDDYKREVENFTRSCKVDFSVLGGIHPSKNISEDSILKWKASIPKSPMPVKIVLTSLETFLTNKQRLTYREALNFYISLSKVLPWEIELKNGNVLTLKSLVKTGSFKCNSQVSGAVQETNLAESSNKVVAKCPNGKRILFGFIVRAINDSISVYSCMQNRYIKIFVKTKLRTFCSPESDMNGTIWIWILCGNSLGLELKGYSSEDKITCENGEKILTGFIITKKDKISSVQFTACNTGQSTCSKSTDESSFLWAVCVDERIPGLKDVVTLANSGDRSIDSDLYSIAGLTSLLNLCTLGVSLCYKKQKSESSVCERFIKGCPKSNVSECIFSLSWGIFTT